jgi:hypothetical protein
MVSCLVSFLYKRSSEVFDIAGMMKSKSLSVSIVCNLVLLAFDFFRDVGFMGETFLLLYGSTSLGGFYGSVTSPCFC